MKKMNNPLQNGQSELKVFISFRESKCDECGQELGSHAWIVLQGEKGAVCLTCADLDHLVFATRKPRMTSGWSAASIGKRRVSVCATRCVE